MPANLTRRAFLATGSSLAVAATAPGIEPIARSNPRPHLRLSLAAYSFRQFLNLARKPKPSMTLDDFADLAASLEVDAIEPTAYYFSDTSPTYLARLKAHCTRLGLDISGTAVGNNFCRTNTGKMKEELAHVKMWAERASVLGAKTVRIFAGYVEKGDTAEKARARCVAAIEEACEHAGKYGVLLALENHGGITATAEQILAIVKAVRSDWFGVNLDTGNFNTPDPYADLARLAPYAVTVQIKTEMRRAGGKSEPADFSRKIEILRQAGYRGYVALEYEAEDPKAGVPKAIAQLKKLIAS